MEVSTPQNKVSMTLFYYIVFLYCLLRLKNKKDDAKIYILSINKK